MNFDKEASSESDSDCEHSPLGDSPPLPIMRSLLGGVLMGLANLVPGVSGGTMILVCGLYDEFIGALADVTRFRFTKRNVLFLALVGMSAGMAIGLFAGLLRHLVLEHRSAMYSLFIGLTLGGAPLLFGMLKKWTTPACLGLILGLGLMVTIAYTKAPRPEGQSSHSSVASERATTDPNYTLDFSAGVLGMSAMVLPGISGAYMLLLLGRYESTMGAIKIGKDYAFSWGNVGELGDFLPILIPIAIGCLVSLVFLSNLMKWLLHRYQKFTLGVLTGVLLGSVVGIWPFDAASGVGDYAMGMGLALAGLATTVGLARVSR